MIGQVVGSYEILELLGHGSTGTVYKARNTCTEDEGSPSLVALKIKGKEQRDHGRGENPFIKEFDILVAMHAANPPCFVRPLECGTTESVHFLATELMDETLDSWGARLRQTLASGFTDQMANAILLKLRGTIDALATAHALGYSVRDVSPRNFLVRGDLVKATDLSSAIRVTRSTVHPDTRVTPRYSSHSVVIGGAVRYSDDYEALCYLWLDLLTDRLAWRKCKRPSIIRDIKTTCLETFTECYSNLPPLLTSMLCAPRDYEENSDFKDYHRKLIELTDKLQPDDLAHLIADFRDSSNKFAIYDGVF